MRRFAALWSLWLCLAAPATLACAQEPDVQELTIAQFLQLIEQNDAAVTVVNFWATWCAPCIEEFPDFVRLGKDLADQGVEVLFVSMDFEDEMAVVKAFLAEQGYTETSFLRVGKDHAFIAAVHDEWSGVLPATFLYSRNGRPADFWQGKPVGYEALKARVLAALDS